MKRTQGISGMADRAYSARVRLEETGRRLRAANDDLQAQHKELQARNETLQQQQRELERAEDALRQSEARLRTILENLAEGLVVSDLEGNLTHWNRAALEIHGFVDPEEGRRALGEFTRVFELATMDGTPLSVEEWPLARILRGDELHDLELRIRRLEGDWRRVFSYGGTLVRDSDGRPLIAIVTITDITDRRRAEEEIRQLNTGLERRVRERTAELETANRELEEFSYSISHDLRTPLRSIDGFSRLLLEDYGDQVDARGKDYLSRVRAAAQRLGQLMDDILGLSRAVRAEMRPSRVDLSALAAAVVADLQRSEPGRQAEVAIAPGMVAEGDPHLLRLVLQNLLGNAWKFTRDRPVAYIRFEAQTEGGHPTYCVSDNGVGFDPAYAGKLFKPFQRLHTNGGFPGTGIGLALVQRVVRRHRGRVWAQGAVDRGATFCFTLGGPGGAEAAR